MIGRVAGLVRGEALRARALRSSFWSLFGFGATQAMRLAANLVLTRLLFPEDFGLMAIVTAFVIGLQMVSDVGIEPSVQQNPRGDERAFLDTAWTLQAMRGVLLWLGSCLLAWPVAAIYGEPVLAQILPVVGLSMIIAGFNPTALYSASRHLRLGRVTFVEVAGQLVALAPTVALAWWTRSVWALALGTLLSAAAKLLLARLVFPGPHDRFRLEPESVRALIRFGKWILLSTAGGFLLVQGDRLVLGLFLPLDRLGVYNIGFFLASLPVHLATALAVRVLIPLYREKPPAASRENFLKIRAMRALLTGFMFALLFVMAAIGVPLVAFLYDPRYAMAGFVIVLVVCVNLPLAIGLTYDQAALAAGDSRGFAVVVLLKSALMIALMTLGAAEAGILGALAGQGAALLISYPLLVGLARRHGAWDPLHDAGFAALGALGAAAALWVHRDGVLALAGG